MKIIDFFEKLLNPKYIKKIRFEVTGFDKKKLSKYNGSVHCLLDDLRDNGKQPKGVEYIGTYGFDGNKIEAYYDDRKIAAGQIEKFLKGAGIRAKRL